MAPLESAYWNFWIAPCREYLEWVSKNIDAEGQQYKTKEERAIKILIKILHFRNKYYFKSLYSSLKSWLSPFTGEDIQVFLYINKQTKNGKFSFLLLCDVYHFTFRANFKRIFISTFWFLSKFQVRAIL